MNRRSAIKIGTVGVAAAVVAGTVSGCNGEASPAKAQTKSNTLGKHNVVIIGGGFGGLTVANNLMKKNKGLDVLVIEKRDTFMSCPVSNTYLGKLEGMNLGTFVFDYAQVVDKYGYKMLKSEVVSIDRANKTVTTAKGVVGYEILVLAPGIAYNYENQFPKWSKDKIAEVQRKAPAALIPGSEHVALERMLANMDDGNVVISVPSGKFRCPPAPFERACMIAAYMDKEDIKGKVIILNPKEKFAKYGAFMESFKDLYADRIVYMPNARVNDVDVDGKTVSFMQEVGTGKRDEDNDEITKTVQKTMSYEVLNLMPDNKANPVIEMASINTVPGSFHKVVMNGCSFKLLQIKMYMLLVML
ncbi:MAG: FAD/NAD(P)-binding oxidoreductase [Sulfurimonas sp.]|nr:FAD/NAD(P)-binding oxidoreductase [Sulfurimonas sp.]